ncbi:MAG: CRTAC1 family protein [Verrucomicrobia bacterium]|nr:CRTAC1 family protein [Verrucomicrobiota bacterium]MDA1066312.1 CRTAC1 family protein [Verrucomicrobiota bacterium]
MVGAPGGFTETTIPAGISYQQYRDDYVTPEEVNILTGGAAAGDFDNDGWVDLFVTRVDDTDILYRNRGGFRAPDAPWFEDVTATANILINDSTNGAAWGDIDNDGDLDLIVTTIQSPRFYLYLNQGNGTFVEEGIERGVALIGETDHNGFSIAFGDYDRDGWLDVHICEWGILRSAPGVENHTVLLRNRGPSFPGFFENATEAAGVVMGTGDQEKLFAFASSFADFDGDGWPDLAVASDFRTSQIFWNNGDGTFLEGTDAAGINKGSSEMGSAIGDFNLDGLLDWFITCIEDNRFYRNLGDRVFAEEAGMMGLQNAGWGWGTQMLDMENDGDLDLIMTNGYHAHETTKEIYYASNNRDLMHLWRNDDASYTDVSAGFGIRDDGEGKGLLLFDYDRDGDQDVFVTNTGEASTLYRNDIHNGNAWLRLELKGTASNSQGIGSRVKVTATDAAEPRYYELIGANNFLSQSEAAVHIGLGSLVEPVHQVEISWPSGKIQILRDVAINQHLSVEEPPFFFYSDWVVQKFPVEDQSDSEVVAQLADKDKDGVNNLWEYVFGLHPLIANVHPLFQLQSVEDEVNAYCLNFSRGIEGDDIHLSFECSTDLDSWSELTDYVETVVPGNDRNEVQLKFSKAGPFFFQIRALVEW